MCILIRSKPPSFQSPQCTRHGKTFDTRISISWLPDLDSYDSRISGFSSEVDLGSWSCLGLLLDEYICRLKSGGLLLTKSGGQQISWGQIQQTLPVQLMCYLSFARSRFPPPRSPVWCLLTLWLLGLQRGGRGVRYVSVTSRTNWNSTFYISCLFWTNCIKMCVPSISLWGCNKCSTSKLYINRDCHLYSSGSTEIPV